MNRREMLRLIPVSIAGLTGATARVRASEEQPDVPLPREHAGPVFRVELGRAGCDEVLVLEGTEIL